MTLEELLNQLQDLVKEDPNLLKSQVFKSDSRSEYYSKSNGSSVLIIDKDYINLRHIDDQNLFESFDEILAEKGDFNFNRYSKIVIV